MAKANRSESLSVVMTVMAPMVVPFVMAASAVPSVVMAAAAVPAMVMAAAAVSVAMMPTTVFDLNYCPVLRGEGRDANSGGSGQGHCQRGNQCRADQNDTSHAGSSRSLDRDPKQVPIIAFVPRLLPQLPNCPGADRLPASAPTRG